MKCQPGLTNNILWKLTCDYPEVTKNVKVENCLGIVKQRVKSQKGWRTAEDLGEETITKDVRRSRTQVSLA